MKLPKNEIQSRTDEIMLELGITNLKERSVLRLSGGEKRLISLASVLVMRQPLLLLDEPTAFMDPKGRRKLINILKKLKQAFIVATHDLTFALAVAETASVLSEGKIIAEGLTKDLVRNADIMDKAGLEDIDSYNAS